MDLSRIFNNVYVIIFRLRTGWCVAREVSPLTPAEQAAILEVKE